VGSICYQAARLALRRGEGELSAEEAWAAVAAAIRSHGSYREPRFTNPALARAVGAMDWNELCTNPNVEATRAHFFRLFGAFQEGCIARRVEELGGAAQCVQLAERWLAPLSIAGPSGRTAKPSQS
jgi:hypothetical protein